MSNQNEKIFKKMWDEGVDIEVFESAINETPVIKMTERESGVVVEISLDGADIIKDRLAIDVFWIGYQKYRDELNVCPFRFNRIEGLDAVKKCIAKYDMRGILLREYCEIVENIF